MVTKTRTGKEPGAAAFVPKARSLTVLRGAVQRCQGCDLYRNATQAVFGNMDAPVPDGGAPHARMMMVGEQPGDREDKEGHPFVGPAGRLLDQCLEEAAIDRKTVYVTNAVKHFKWEPRGKLRIHKKPSSSEIFACGPWLKAEIETIRPELIVCWGRNSKLQSRTVQFSPPAVIRRFWPRSIRHLFCVRRRTKTGIGRRKPSSLICARPMRSCTGIEREVRICPNMQ
jgi:uracil-DNA glycosylase family protein